jgi:hypothetical protein
MWEGKSTACRTAQWIRKHANYSGVIKEITQDDLPANHIGLSDHTIDPIQCASCDPKITVLSGSQTSQPEDWTQGDFDNQNNQSLVIRVDFGQASFLFTGDLESAGLQTLINTYSGDAPGLLKATVYRASHHGSNNGITDPPTTLSSVVSPSVVIFSVGHWDFGKGGKNALTTYFYGHPRLETLECWEGELGSFREKPIKVKAFKGSKKPVNFTVTGNMYATAWDGTIDVTALQDGTISITTSKTQ